MRKLVLLTMAVAALAALTAAGLASAAGTTNGPVSVTSGNVKFTFNGGFSPKALPKKEMAPIALTAEGKIATLDGSHPPALKEAIIETDKNGAIQTKGYPTCTSGKLQATDTKAAEKACGSAIVGTGTTTIQIAFAEQNPINVNSKLLVINGGESGGTTTLYIHAYITVPTPAAVVTTVKIKKHVHGRFGYTSVATIPKIAGGNGSVTSFNLKIDKKYTYKGKKVSVLSAKCTDGKLAAHATAILSDGTKASAEIIRPCTPKG
jgi:hypothetical protein